VLENLKQAFSDAFEWIKKTVMDIITSMGEFVLNKIQAVVDGIKNIANVAKSVVSEA